MRIMAIFLVLLTFSQGAFHLPEEERGFHTRMGYEDYIGRTGQEIREALGKEQEDWEFFTYEMGGPFFRLSETDFLLGFSGEEVDYDQLPDPATCVMVEVPLSVAEPDADWQGEEPLTLLEELFGAEFTYEDTGEGPWCYFTADMDRRLMVYIFVDKDKGLSGDHWLEILYMNQSNYEALEKEAG